MYPPPKCVVYVLRSLSAPERYYTGVTSDLEARLADHNAGRSPHTADGRPWTVDVAIRFADDERALKFERYLKSGSGCDLRSGICAEVERCPCSFVPRPERPGGAGMIADAVKSRGHSRHGQLGGGR
jgi:putative endonuclease